MNHASEQLGEQDVLQNLEAQSGLEGLRILQKKGFNIPGTMPWFMKTADSPELSKRTAANVMREFIATFMQKEGETVDADEILQRIVMIEKAQLKFIKEPAAADSVLDVAGDIDTHRSETQLGVQRLLPQMDPHSALNEVESNELGDEHIFGRPLTKDDFSTEL